MKLVTLSPMAIKLMLVYLSLLILFASLGAYNRQLTVYLNKLAKEQGSLSSQAATLTMQVSAKLSHEQLRLLAYSKGMVPYLESQAGSFELVTVTPPQLEPLAPSRLEVYTQWP